MTEIPTPRRATDYLAEALGSRTTAGPNLTMLEPELRELVTRYGSDAVHNTLRSIDPCHGYDFTGAGTLPQARETDPGTSHAAAQDPSRRMRAAGQVAELLLTYAGTNGARTAEEACAEVERRTGGTVRPSWRRVSDLRRLGLVESIGQMDIGSSGLLAELLAVTPRGREIARQIHEARSAGRRSVRLDVG